MNGAEQFAQRYASDKRLFWINVATYSAVPIGMLLGHALHSPWAAFGSCVIAITVIRTVLIGVVGYMDGRYLRNVEATIAAMHRQRSEQHHDWHHIAEIPTCCELCREQITSCDLAFRFTIEMWKAQLGPRPHDDAAWVCEKCEPRVSKMMCDFAEEAGFSYRDRTGDIHNVLEPKV